MKTISTKLSNLAGCIGCLFPIAGAGFLIFGLLRGAGWTGVLGGVILFFIAIPIFAKAKEWEDRALIEQKKGLQSMKSPSANEDSMPTYVSGDALTRVTIDEEAHRIYCWRAVDADGKPMEKPRANMTYSLDEYAFGELEAVAMVENANVINLSFASTTVPLQTYIKQKIISKLPKGIPTNKVHTLALVIQLGDEPDNIYQINFRQDQFSYLVTDTSEYEALMKELKEWFIHMDTALTTVSLEDSENTPIFEKPKLNPMTRAVSNEKIDEAPVPPAEEKDDEPKELSYFDKLVADNKRQLDSKGPAEKK